MKAVCGKGVHDVYFGHYQPGEEHAYCYAGMDAFGDPVFIKPQDWQRWHKPGGRDGWKWLWCRTCESTTKHYSKGVMP